MTLQEKISSDLKVAMKESNTEAKNILRVVIGEFNRAGKQVSDGDATAIIKKMVTNAKEMNNTFEIDFLSEYLPKQLSEDELSLIIMNFIMNLPHAPTMKDMGTVMSYLKENYEGQYDGKLASTIIRDKLK